MNIVFALLGIVTAFKIGMAGALQESPSPAREEMADGADDESGER